METTGTRLGALLVSRRLVSPPELDAGLALQAEIGGLLGQLLVRMGAVAEGDLLDVLTDQLHVPLLKRGDYPDADKVAAFCAELRAPLAWWSDRGAIAWREPGLAGGPDRVVCAALQPLDSALRERLAQAVDG